MNRAPWAFQSYNSLRFRNFRERILKLRALDKQTPEIGSAQGAKLFHGKRKHKVGSLYLYLISHRRSGASPVETASVVFFSGNFSRFHQIIQSILRISLNLKFCSLKSNVMFTTEPTRLFVPRPTNVLVSNPLYPSRFVANVIINIPHSDLSPRIASQTSHF